MEDEDRGEKRRLASRIRSYVLAMVLCFFLQGAVLAYVLRSDSPSGWALWVGAVVFAVVGIIVGGARASRLARRYRRLD